MKYRFLPAIPDQMQKRMYHILIHPLIHLIYSSSSSSSSSSRSISMVLAISISSSFDVLSAISCKSKLSYKSCLWYSFISDITSSLSFSVPILGSLWKNFFKVCKILCKKLCNRLFSSFSFSF